MLAYGYSMDAPAAEARKKHFAQANPISLQLNLQPPLNLMIFRLIFSTLISVSTLLLTGCNASAATPSVTLENMRAGLDNPKFVVIDIREPSEHALGIAKDVRLMPMSQWMVRGWPTIKP